MQRASTPCSVSCTSPLVPVNVPVDKENLRRQIVGLARKREPPKEKEESSRDDPPASAPVRRTIIARARHHVPKATRFSSDLPPRASSFMPSTDPHDCLKNFTSRSKSATNMSSEEKSKPKIVRFRMDEHTIGKQKAPIVSISEANVFDPKRARNGKLGIEQSYEVRGSAIAVRKEGLKGLVEVKEMCSENEKRQNSLQASLKIFRRRIKFNQDKFIQPNDNSAEDYVIHTPRAPFCDVNSATPAPEDRPNIRPLSSTDEHVRVLKSALQTKRNGGTTVTTRVTESYDTGENTKNIKCSYRLPENLNWGKEVSFKDIKDDSIPNVKTYVLEEDAHPHVKYKKNHAQNSVTLNTHNLSVHNSITQVNGHKVKVGDCEVSFDPRVLDWLEDSLSNSKMYRSASFMTDETLECCNAPSVKRRVAAKT